MNAQTYIKLSAPSDSNGNPRRLYVVHQMNALNPDAGAERLAIIVENYDGNQQVRSRYPMAVNVTEIAISGGEFRRWLNVKKIDDGYKREEMAEKFAAALGGKKVPAKTRDKVVNLALDFANTSAHTQAEALEMAITRWTNTPSAFH